MPQHTYLSLEKIAQTVDDGEQGGLPGAVGADEASDGALGYLEGAGVEGATSWPLAWRQIPKAGRPLPVPGGAAVRPRLSLS